MVNKYLSFSQKVTSFCLIFVVFLAAFFLSMRLSRLYPATRHDDYYRLQADKLQMASPGLRSLAADIFYIQGIMAVASNFLGDINNIAPIQDNMACALLLDPRLKDAYSFAGAVLAKDESVIRKGNEFLMKYGYLAANDWHIPYLIAFNFYALNEFDKAIEYFQRAAVLPDAPYMLKGMQAMLFYKANMARIGVQYLEDVLSATKDETRAQAIAVKIRWLKNLIFLEDAAEVFKQRYHRPIVSLSELVEKHIIPSIPQDDYGQGFFWDMKANRVSSRLR